MIASKIINPPARYGFWNNNYVTYRRLWLDTLLSAFAHEMRGVVFDLGGKHANKRGTFVSPEWQASTWQYVNLDLSTHPHINADVIRVPVQSNKVDCIICTEVLEHLPNPQSCVDEMRRLLREEGLVFASVPFIYPIHADPFDFQRFTEDGLRHLFREFSSVEIYRMGGYPGVLGLMIELGIPGLENGIFFGRFIQWSMKWISRWLCWYDMLVFDEGIPSWSKFTTGYFVRASR